MQNLSASLIGGQIVIGLINGSLYALMSLGIAIIFGMLRVANFVHGALYMVGAFCSWILLNLPVLFPNAGLPTIGYWPSLILVPIIVGSIGIMFEKLFISRIYAQDHAYGLLLTLGLTLVCEGLMRQQFGSTSRRYAVPELLQGAQDLGFLLLPNYRAWVIVASFLICGFTWYLIEKTRMGSYIRAAQENPVLVAAFGINVPRLLTLTYGTGVGLAGFAGVMAAPIYQVSPLMGGTIVMTVFAIVVIGGMGSIMGSVISGYALGVLEALAKIVWPEISSTVVFLAMVIVLVARPAGLFGRSTS